ncbi:ribonuclease D [Rubricella aquisinus]|uniref:Ribonuclease D n=1 Tax=Rubricella aquisinus TaxID=2028108 RepID=A0A840X7D5_9RHOB|nr:ribonuclease D [Rubricella aquisinus]MBB5516617.1 ribonuclease D [Rubricella aquisinus]
MLEISTTDALAAFCSRAKAHSFVTVDTEFLRERTYYAQLCLVQMALPEEGDDAGALIDTLADGLDLGPLFDLMADPSVVKVFHAARQDLEIFWTMGRVIPEPLFDTQVAAMVCGYGEQVGYETLVRKIAKADLDKSSRFTDWSRRPLSAKQKTYALADVTHLRDIYLTLKKRLDETGRQPWVEEEMSILRSPSTYEVKPEDAWQRLKTRTTSGRFLAIVRELAQWRESEAQSRDVPRNRLIKDDALLEVASNRPRSVEDLNKSRLLLREARKGPAAEAILAAVQRGIDCPDDALPRVQAQKRQAPISPALSDLLRVLLKAKSERAGVAQKLIATSADLDALASEPEGDHLVLKGWRRDIFGADALDLIAGNIALGVKGNTIKIIRS